jgi:hypothetical protein
MTCVARLALRVIFRIDLGEAARLGDILGMAAHAKLCHVRSRWFHRPWIIRMSRLWAVAGLTVDVRVHSLGFDFQYVRMTALASFVACIGHRPRSNVLECVSPVKAVASKALRNYGGTNGHKNHRTQHENGRHTNQVSRIPKPIHWRTTLGASPAARRTGADRNIMRIALTERRMYRTSVLLPHSSPRVNDYGHRRS